MTQYSQNQPAGQRWLSFIELAVVVSLLLATFVVLERSLPATLQALDRLSLTMGSSLACLGQLSPIC